MRTLIGNSTSLALLALATAMGLGGCAPSAAPDHPQRASAHGGISGGRGGTLPARPATPEQIRDIVKNAKRELRMVLRAEAQLVEKGAGLMPTDRLLAGPKSILDVLEEAPIELRMTSPCHDEAGIEVEGSVVSANPGGLCISAHLIAQKVSVERARVETIALIGHELAHLAGADETLARQQQERIADLLAPTTPDASENVARAAQLGAFTARSAAESLHYLATRDDSLGGTELVADFFLRFMEYVRLSAKAPYQVPSPQERDLQALLMTKALLISQFAGDPLRYSLVFNGASSVSFGEFARATPRYQWMLPSRYESVNLVRFQSAADAVGDLEEIIGFLKRQEELARAILTGDPLPPQ